MIKILVIMILFFSNILAKQITPNEVYGQVMLIQEELHELHKYFGITHHHEKIINEQKVNASLKPRNVWQKSYEIIVKINILRSQNNLPIIQPINMVPVLNLNPDLVYEQTQRILTEFHILKTRLNLINKENHVHKEKVYKGKTPMDVFNGFVHVSAGLDELNKGGVTPSYVFGENMRVLYDITIILDHLNIIDNTIPAKKNVRATPTNTFHTGMLILDKIKQLQIASGIDFVDFSSFRKLKQTPSEVFSITQMIIAELQTIKAYLGIKRITSAAIQYKSKTPIEVDQLMSWNLRKLNIIHSLVKDGK